MSKENEIWFGREIIAEKWVLVRIIRRFSKLDSSCSLSILVLELLLKIYDYVRGAVYYFGSVHMDLWTAMRLNFVWTEQRNARIFHPSKIRPVPCDGKFIYREWKWSGRDEGVYHFRLCQVPERTSDVCPRCCGYTCEKTEIFRL